MFMDKQKETRRQCRRAFWEGFFSVWTLSIFADAGEEIRFAPIPSVSEAQAADGAALRSDWQAVGDEIRGVMRKLEASHV